MSDYLFMMRCPYNYCSKTVRVLEQPPDPWTRVSRGLIENHQLSNEVLTSLSGPCPASLLPVGVNPGQELPPETARVLRERAEVQSKQIPSVIATELERERQSLTNELPRSGHSQSLRGPHRVGREPEQDQEDWQLGGREDEDSGKLAPPIKPPRLPVGVLGQEIGTHVASIDELLQLNQATAVAGGEAIASINEAQNALERAVASCEEALNHLGTLQGTAQSQSLGEYHQLMAQARDGIQDLMPILEEQKNVINRGQTIGEEFSNRLLS